MSVAPYRYGTGALVSQTAANMSVPYPTVPTCPDDVLLAFIFHRTNGSPTMPAGWTQKAQVTTASSSARLTIFWKRQTAIDSTSNVTVTLSGTVAKAAQMVGWRGCVETGDPFEDSQTVQFTAGTSGARTCPSLSATGTKSGVVAAVCMADDTTAANGSGFSQNVPDTTTSTPSGTGWVWTEEILDFENTSSNGVSGSIAYGVPRGTNAALPGFAFTTTLSSSQQGVGWSGSFIRVADPVAPTDVTDNFNRTENPLAAPWINDVGDGGLKADGTKALAVGGGGSAWYPVGYSSNQVARMRVAVPVNNGNGAGIGWGDLANANTWSGYYLYPGEFSAELYRIDAASATLLAEHPTQGVGSGQTQQLDWDMTVGKFRAWVSDGADWYLLCTAVETTYGFAKAQYALINPNDNVIAFDDFATTLPPAAAKGILYRRNPLRGLNPRPRVRR